jgi:hypothetical protein
LIFNILTKKRFEVQAQHFGPIGKKLSEIDFTLLPKFEESAIFFRRIIPVNIGF